MINFLKYYCKKINFWYSAANAKGHGTHSPFVYDFIINVLNDDRHFYAFDKKDNYKTNQDKLIFKIINYYNFKEALVINENTPLSSNKIECNKYDVVIIESTEAVANIEIGNNDDETFRMIIIKNIDKKSELYNYFLALQQHENVDASIQLFDLGILICNKNFKVKQHFKINYK